MFTIIYKGVYIHGYIDRDECRVQLGGMTGNAYKSLLAAKRAITRHLSIAPSKR